MATTTLYPAALSFGLGSAGGHTSTLVGGQSALSDSSDATYAEVWGYRTATEGGNDYVRVDLPAVTDLGTLTSVGPLSIRLSHDLTPGTPAAELWTPAVFDDSFNLLGTFDRTGTPAEGSPSTVTDWVFNTTYAGASFATALQAGTAWVALDVPIEMSSGLMDWQMRYYEFALTIEYTSTLSPCSQTVAPSDVIIDSGAEDITIVGGGTSLSDDSDTTYVEFADAGGTIYGPVSSGRNALDLTVNVRASATTSDAAPFPLCVTINTSGGDFLVGLVDGDALSIPSGAATAVYSHTFSDTEFTAAGTTLTAVSAALRAGGRLYVFPSGFGGSVGDVCRVYEASIQVGHKCRTVYPLRRHPRSDGYGLGPKRHYPPPETRRHAGGYK